MLYQRDQAEACWRAIVAPLLLVLAEESELTKRMAGELGEDHLHSLFANLTTATIRGAGHMIHHERLEETAVPRRKIPPQPIRKQTASELLEAVHPRPLTPRLQLQLARVAQVPLEQRSMRCAVTPDDHCVHFVVVQEAAHVEAEPIIDSAVSITIDLACSNA